MVDPVVCALAAAPSDDEPVTEQDRRRFKEGQAWFANNGAAAAVEPEALQSEQIDAVARPLEVMIDPDDEPLNDEDRRAVTASREYFQQNPGQSVSFEVLAAECGLTTDQIQDRKNAHH